MGRFVHLHIHSHYSLLDGLGKIPELVSRAKELGMDALALTDHGVLYGAIEFYQECTKAGIKPIIGMEAYIAPHRMTDRRPRIDDRATHLTLLAANIEGYRNLMIATTRAHLDGFYYKPRIDKEFLRAHAAGLIGLSGCLGSEIAQALAADDFAKAEAAAVEYRDIFGEGNFFLEVQDHPELPLQGAINQKMFALSERTGIPTVATKDAHYIHPDDAEAQDVLLSIQTGQTITDPTRFSMRGVDYSLASGSAIAAAFADHPEAIEATARIADRCTLVLELGKWNFPAVDLPPGETPVTELRRRAQEGLLARIPNCGTETLERLQYELGIIEQKGFSPYFLVVSDYVNWARAQGIVTTTRGSAAGSLVSYTIGVTTVNPMYFQLPFERFLNPSRPSPPDIDVDFADNRRDEVLAYVTQKYGKDRVAQICTFGTMMARGSVRDVARALGHPYAFGDRLAKMIPFGSQGFPMTIEKAKEENPELKTLADEDVEVRRVLELAEKMEGCARHVSVHAAGVVISSTPLTDYTPLQRESGGEKIITQYEMGAVEAVGLLKMDFLGIRNLSILGSAVELIKKTKGETIDLENLPLDDAKTFELLGKGDTIGLFQLGGAGMTRYLRELEPSSIFDIQAMVALYRPGPIESIPEFIRRKKNPRTVRLLDPRMKDILSMSYGIITYQDDVLLIAIKLAGYTWEEADKLRKAMGKKIPKEMAAQKEKFIGGCAKNGLAEDKAQELWKLIEPFAAYGFNKAHAASYAMVAYQTAYLKAHFPAEFMTAVLTADAGDMEKVAAAVAECAPMNMEVLPPEVNESREGFTMVDDAHIRFGLLAIKNLGEDVVRVILEERDAHGPFRSVEEFIRRISAKSANKKSFEALAKSGALDALGERGKLLANMEDLLRWGRETRAAAESGQRSLFHDAGERLPVLRNAPPASREERLAWEKELLGLYLTEHPFRDIAAALKGILVPCARVKEEDARALIRVGGIISRAKRITTRKGEGMMIVQIEDPTGFAEAVVFPRLYKETESVWREGANVMISGRRSARDEETRFIAEGAIELTPATVERLRSEAHVPRGAQERAAIVEASVASPEHLRDSGSFTVEVPARAEAALWNELRTLFAAHPGSARVYLIVSGERGPKRIETNFSVAPTPELVEAIRSLTGSACVTG